MDSRRQPSTLPPAQPGAGVNVSQCCGCGTALTETDGPTHPYIQSSPACWAIYGELTVRAMTPEPKDPVGVAGGHHVDCYAVQHPGGGQHDRRQRQSVAVHLISLCLLIEQDRPAWLASSARGRIVGRLLTALGLTQWPYLAPPVHRGAVTAAEVYRATGPEELDELVLQWTASAWSAWSAHHDTVRAWVEHV